MLYCENGHRSYLRVLVANLSEILIADSKGLTQAQTEEIVEGMLMGECPVCSGKMPLMQSAAR